MEKLYFGPAGIPISAKGSNTVQGIKKVRELNLEAMELEFVRGVNISKEKAPKVKNESKKQGIKLTCHAPYFINLNAQEKSKLEESKKRIIHSGYIANLCGAWSVCFHAGFYMKKNKEEVYKRIKKALQEITALLRENNNEIWIRPESTGKRTQFGDLRELIRLSEEVEGVMPCIDFAHLHARSNGEFNTYEEFCRVLEELENKLGREALDNMHIHVSGINYSNKGELNHLNLKNSDFKYLDLIKAWKEFKIKGIVISESPNLEEDALLLKKNYFQQKE